MNTIPCIKEELVIQSFHANVRHTRMREKLSTHRIENTRELWELADRCARAEEGVRVPGEEEPEDKAVPAKSKKRDPGPDKRVFVTEPLHKKAKPASTSEGDEDPWCHVHPDGNHPLKDRRPARCSTLSTSSAWCCSTPGSGIP